MIEELLNHPHVLYQTADDSMPNEAIAAYIDAGGTLVISQEDRFIVIDRKSIPELCTLLKKMAAIDAKKGPPK